MYLKTGSSKPASSIVCMTITQGLAQTKLQIHLYNI